MIDRRVFSAPNSEGRCTVVEDDNTLICKVDDAMRIMLIGRGYLARRESYPTDAVKVALPVLMAEQMDHPRKARRLRLVLRLRRGNFIQAVFDLATRDWWQKAPEEEIAMAEDIHDHVNASASSAPKKKGGRSRAPT
jgi:hypothetical protein